MIDWCGGRACGRPVEQALDFGECELDQIIFTAHADTFG
jgi:hypothetical protein